MNRTVAYVSSNLAWVRVSELWFELRYKHVPVLVYVHQVDGWYLLLRRPRRLPTWIIMVINQWLPSHLWLLRRGRSYVLVDGDNHTKWTTDSNVVVRVP